MEYEIGKKLDMLESQNGYLASRIAVLEEDLKKVLAILEIAMKEDNSEDVENEPNEGTDDEPPERGDNIGGTIPVKRGRGRPRKDETIIAKPTSGINPI